MSRVSGQALHAAQAFKRKHAMWWFDFTFVWRAIGWSIAAKTDAS